MNLTHKAAASLLDEPGITGSDLRVWLALVDAELSAAELAPVLGTARYNTAASCRKLLTAGWIDVAETIGKSIRYTARSTRNPNAHLPGHLSIV